MSNPALSADLTSTQGSNQTRGTPPTWTVWLAGLVIVLAAGAVYSNSFNGEFADDSAQSILQNPTIQHGWWEALHPPGAAETVSARPLLNFSFALNYQLDGFNVWGYHAVNLAIQMLAGLTLFGLVRRTLLRPVLSDRYGASALPLAFVIALIWTVHPLQTESVTYVAQRAESLMGLFYLLTLYCLVRGADSSRAGVWYALSATACLLGMFTKETMVTAPVLVWLYDRTFVAGTFAAAWRRRGSFYAALACLWLRPVWVIANVAWPADMAMMNASPDGLSLGLKSFAYSLKQCEAIVHYLWLSFWPHPLVLKYGNELVTNPLDVAPQIVVLTLLAGGTLYALWRLPAVGFLGAWFFVILAPTSSVVPVFGEIMAEHRMYLSLAAELVLAVLGLRAILGRAAYGILLAAALGLGSLTYERNRDYRTNISISTDMVAKNPDSPRAHQLMEQAFLRAGRTEEATEENLLGIILNPNDPQSENNLGNIYTRLGQLNEAIIHYQKEIQRNPTEAETYYNLGNAYYITGQRERARDAYLEAVRINPDFALAHTNLASVYEAGFGETDQAIVEYEAAIRANPNLPEAQTGLGNLYLKTNRAAEAIPHFSAAIGLNPNYGDAYLGMGNALFMTGHASEAATRFETAATLMPNSAGTHNNYGLALLQLNRFAEAARQFEETLRVDSRYPDAQNNLDKSRQLAQQPQNALQPSAEK